MENKVKLDITPIFDWTKKREKPVIVSGPCSAESEEQVLKTAKAISEIDPSIIFRAGIWKPRTRPGSFEGVGAIGLQWLKKVKQEIGLKVTTEIASAQHVEECLKNDVDVLWIGARTTGNPFSMQEIANSLKGVDIPVMIKNPIHPDLQLWIGAIERLNAAGIKKITAIHRGFHSHEQSSFRNEPRWELAIELKLACPDLPIICDPSHICGNTTLIPYISQKAMDLDMDGLMIETHNMPSIAKSDANQQLTPKQLADLLSKIIVRSSDASDKEFTDRLTQLRTFINGVDDKVLQSLANRMSLSQEIGRFKRDNNITILQTIRWEEILNNQIECGAMLGLDEEFVKKLYMLIHEESIRLQSQIMNS